MSENREITMVVNGNTSFDQVQLEHNERKEGCYGKNVNPELSHLNIIQVNSTVQDFFDDTFQKPYEEFVKGKQEDTKLSKKQKEMYFDKSKYPDTYLEKLYLERKRYEEEYAAKKAAGVSIKELDKMKQPEIPVKEMIIQLGDRDSEFGTLSGDTKAHETADKILLEFVADFEKKYPNAKVLGYYIHHDEISNDGKGGTVHMHLDYVWVSKQRSKGQSVVCSQNGALKEMGFKAPEKGKHKKGEPFLPITKFQEELRANLEEISKKFGYERKEIPAEDKGKKQVDVKTFRNSKDAEKEIEAKKENAEKEAQTIVSNAEQRRDKIISEARDEKAKIESDVSALRTEKEFFETETAKQGERFFEIQERYDDLEGTVSDVEKVLEDETERQISNIRKTADEAKKDMTEYIKKTIPENTRIPDFDNIEWVKVKKEKKGMFDKQEYEELPRLNKAQIELVKQNAGLTRADFIDNIDSRFSKFTSSLIKGLNAAREGMRKVMYEVKGLIKLQKRNEELEKKLADKDKHIEQLVAAEVKKQVGAIMKKNTELTEKVETLISEKASAETDRDSYYKELLDLDEQAKKIGLHDNEGNPIKTINDFMDLQEEMRDAAIREMMKNRGDDDYDLG